MTDLQYMSAEDVALSLESAKLEMRYQEALRQAERLYEEERVRALRVQLLLLEEDNDDLRDQMHEDEQVLRELEANSEQLRDLLAVTEAECQAVQIDAKAQSREIDRYKAEVDALTVASSDSTKLLSEKLSLSREIALLRPEIEHLKSQANTQQNVLAEKLSLERELSALQVELENEKRAIQRMRSHDKVSGHGESVMLNEIEDLKKELTKEKRNVQKQERDHMKKIVEWESQKETLESKLEAFRTKLRTTKEQLKEAQDEIERAETAKFARSAEATKARMNGGNSRKRNIARFDPDMTIGTPGNGGPAKKQKTSIIPGDKSSFSITPFLNRTMSILPESPSDVNSAANDGKTQEVYGNAATLEGNDDSDVPSARPPSKTVPVAKSKAAEPLKESTKSKANKVVKKPALPKVTEEEAEKESEPMKVEPPKTVPLRQTEATEPKKSGLFANRPTIFDEDEDSAPKRTTKKLNLAGLRGGAGGISLKKVNLGGKNKVLAEFSPLKKDRNLVF